MFKKLPPKIQEQFYTRLEIFITDKNNPLLNNHSVDRIYLRCRSINVTGDYRAIFEETDQLILFVRIGTHSELYK